MKKHYLVLSTLLVIAALAITVVSAANAYEYTVAGYCHVDDAVAHVDIEMDGYPTYQETDFTFPLLLGTHTFTVPDVDDDGHIFKEWTSGIQLTSITVDDEGSDTVIYSARYDLTITSDGAGTTDAAPGVYTYWHGDLISVTAIPGQCATFDHWVLDGSPEYANPIEIEMETEHTLHAEFRYNAIIRSYCWSEMKPIEVDLAKDGGAAGSTPQQFNDLEDNHTFTVPDFDPLGHRFTHWDTGETSTTITINTGCRHTAYYGNRQMPALTEWGMLVLLLLLVAAGVVVIRRHRRMAIF